VGGYEKMKIDIWSDIMCPYCYVGKRNLSLALKELDLDKDAEIIYHSFELNPKAKSEGKTDTIKYLTDKYNIGAEQAQKMLDRIIEMGKAVGLELSFDSIIHTNTFNAHRLIHFAKRHNKELETVEALFKANFIDFSDVGDIEILGDIGNEVGLNRQEVIDMLKTDEFFSEVNNDKYKAVELDINSVPYFIINDKYAVPGAQPVKVFMEVFKKANKDKES
jgi:predicted DsbA family dithiol-disulfide isomerase